jgi:Uma2 family endonuclease
MSIAPLPSDEVLLPRHRFTATDIRRMIEAGVLPDKARIELIGGELIDMPSEGGPHWDAKTEIVNWLMRRLPEDVRIAPDGPLRLSEVDEPEPDFFLFPAAFRVNNVRGPDVILVIEIADSSIRKDQRVKAPLYARYGVREYWIFDLNERVTWVHSLVGVGQYGQARRIPFGEPLPVPGITDPIVVASLVP